MGQHRSFQTRQDLHYPRASFEITLAEKTGRPTGAHRVVRAPRRRSRGRRIVVAAVAAGVVGGVAGVSQFGDPAQAVARLVAASVTAHPAPARVALPPAPVSSAPSSTPPPALAAPAAPSPSTSSSAPTTTTSAPATTTPATTAAPAPAGPRFVVPAIGTFTSGFGSRWGALHAGVDIANSIGTPIRAVTDGTVLEAGPASGFGLWVRLQHADGTITVYGHMNTIEVNTGQKVAAGQEIATIGNRGNSTGPHLHFEVWQNGLTKIDPLPWLNARGIQL